MCRGLRVGQTRFLHHSWPGLCCRNFINLHLHGHVLNISMGQSMIYSFIRLSKDKHDLVISRLDQNHVIRSEESLLSGTGGLLPSTSMQVVSLVKLFITAFNIFFLLSHEVTASFKCRPQHLSYSPFLRVWRWRVCGKSRLLSKESSTILSGHLGLKRFTQIRRSSLKVSSAAIYFWNIHIWSVYIAYAAITVSLLVFIRETIDDHESARTRPKIWRLTGRARRSIYLGRYFT